MSDERSGRWKQYEFDPQMLFMALSGESILRVVDGIPTDGELVDCGFDRRARVFYLTVQHESFKEISEGEMLPTGVITLEDIDVGELE